MGARELPGVVSPLKPRPDESAPPPTALTAVPSIHLFGAAMTVKLT